MDSLNPRPMKQKRLWVSNAFGLAVNKTESDGNVHDPDTQWEFIGYGPDRGKGSVDPIKRTDEEEQNNRKWSVWRLASIVTRLRMLRPQLRALAVLFILYIVICDPTILLHLNRAVNDTFPPSGSWIIKQ